MNQFETILLSCIRVLNPVNRTHEHVIGTGTDLVWRIQGFIDHQSFSGFGMSRKCHYSVQIFRGILINVFSFEVTYNVTDVKITYVRSVFGPGIIYFTAGGLLI